MAYTNVWDDSQPLDTQAANQGAADFRQTKLDIMQRVASFGAGLLANRPTPETTSGTADWTGVMYWATDTKQTFMWSGSAWVDITSDLPIITPVSPQVIPQKFRNTSPVAITDNGTAQDGQVITLPANALGATSVVRVNGIVYANSGNDTPFSKFALYFNGTIIAEFRGDGLSPGMLAFANSIDFSAYIICIASNSQQSYGTSQQALFTGGSGNVVYGMGNTEGADTTGTIILKTGCEGGINSGGGFTFASLSAIVF